MDETEAKIESRRVRAVQDRLRRWIDTSIGWRCSGSAATFEASRNSGCAATVYSSLSVLPAALVAVAYFHPTGSDANAFAEGLVTHMKRPSGRTGAEPGKQLRQEPAPRGADQSVVTPGAST